MTILVTGSTGKVGRRLLAELGRRGAPARAASRRSDPPLDWIAPNTWRGALHGVDRLFLMVPGGDDGHRSVVGLGERVCAFVDLAVASGVEHVVLMTALGMQHAPDDVEQRAVELQVAASGVTHTILRPNWFHQNLTEGVLGDLAVAGDGVLRLPTGDAAVGFVDADDLAACAAAALLDDADRSGEYDLTGPEMLTFTEVSDLTVGTVIPLRGYEAIEDHRFREFVSALGWAPDYVETVSGLFASIAAGHAAVVSPDVERLLDRPARSLAMFVESLR